MFSRDQPFSDFDFLFKCCVTLQIQGTHISLKYLAKLCSFILRHIDKDSYTCQLKFRYCRSEQSLTQRSNGIETIQTSPNEIFWVQIINIQTFCKTCVSIFVNRDKVDIDEFLWNWSKSLHFIKLALSLLSYFECCICNVPYLHLSGIFIMFCKPYNFMLRLVDE